MPKVTRRPIIAAFVAAAAFSTPALAEGDAAKGEKVFKKCAACHAVGEGAKNKVGPQLNGIVGRKIASAADYKYGKSILALGATDASWTEEELVAYLNNPKKYLRAKLDDKKAKSKMAFKLKKEDQRADVIAYLKTFAAESN